MCRSAEMSDWSIVIAIKRLVEAKSRLASWAGAQHHELVRAMARDTVSAACAAVGSSRVIVVTNLEEHPWLTEFDGLRSATDPGLGLNAALAAGAGLATTSGVAALPADLPAATASAIVATIAEASSDRWFVPDIHGTGTTMLGAYRTPLAPAYGPSSAMRHADAGSARLEHAPDSLRTDVDTPADVGAVRLLGVGGFTEQVLDRHEHAAGPRPSEESRPCC